MEKIEALAKFLEVETDELSEGYDESTFEFGSKEYLILTDSEADQRAGEYIKESLWAFNASFLADKTDLPIEVFQAIQANDKCESNNPAILKIVEKTCGLQDLIDDAISADGRGHFLNTYDGEENEQGEFFIYRVN